MSKDPRDMTGFVDPDTGKRYASFRDAALARINRPEPGENAMTAYGVVITPRRLALFLVTCALAGLALGAML